MKRLARTRTGLVAVAVLACLVLGAGVVGAGRFRQAHMQRVLGRTITPAPSCLHCHPKRHAPPRANDPLAGPRYPSPLSLALSPDGATLYSVVQGTEELVAIDTATQAVRATLSLPGRPHAVAVSPDGRRLAVTVRDADVVRIVDATSLAVMDEVPAGFDPMGVAFTADGARLAVSRGGTHDVSLRPAASDDDEGVRNLVTGRDPYSLAAAWPTGRFVVASRLTHVTRPDRVPRSELTVVDAAAGRVVLRAQLESAHMAEGVAMTPDGRYALVPALRVKNLLPLSQVARGAVMHSVLALVDARPGGGVVQLPLDHPGEYWGDPAGVAVAPDGRTAYVAAGGADAVTVVDLDAVRALLHGLSDAAQADLADDLSVTTRYVKARIPTRANPKALAISPDGRRLYVAERLAGSIAVVDTGRGEVVGCVELGGPETLTPERRGERVFSNAAVTFQGQFSCRSCHPDGGTDGIVWDFDIDGIGGNILETRSLWGIKDTPPFKWNGKNPSLFVQCGPRFAKVLTRSDPFPDDQLADLVAYIESLPAPRPLRLESLDEARARGEALFFRTARGDGSAIAMAQRCSTCHRPPLFTDRVSSDVGSKGETDTVVAFDDPHLLGVAHTAPYMHDGRARSLEEIWTVYSPNDEHGAAKDLSKAELNDLVIYLRSL